MRRGEKRQEEGLKKRGARAKERQEEKMKREGDVRRLKRPEIVSAT